MTLAIFIVIAAFLSLVLILRIAVSRSLQISASANLRAQIQPIDVEAFRNLVNPTEDDYLRRRLPASHFRQVRRARLRATSAYVRSANRLCLPAIPESQTLHEHSSTTPSCCVVMQRSCSSEFILR